MAVSQKNQKAGGSCGASNNKMKGGSVKKSQMGGNKHENKMKGGSKKSKKTKKSGKLAADEAYCVKCRKGVKIVDPTNVTVKKTGRKAKTGKCPVCGTKVFKMVGGAK
jgi:hypothetical protein